MGEPLFSNRRKPNFQDMNMQTFQKTTCAMRLALSIGLGMACAGVSAQSNAFKLSSPDLSNGTFAHPFVLNGFGCTGGNVSPQLVWSNPPAGTQSFALQVHDADAPTGNGRGFGHWAVYNIPASSTQLARGAGHAPATLPAGAFGGNSDFQDTGATGVNGNYGGPCPPQGDQPHTYRFTLYALSVPDVLAAGGIPRTGSMPLFGFVLNKGLGSSMLGKAEFTATYGR
jgi:Raf kinase inhibitor-like YbhB/YbcL family protein